MITTAIALVLCFVFGYAAVTVYFRRRRPPVLVEVMVHTKDGRSYRGLVVWRHLDRVWVPLEQPREIEGEDETVLLGPFFVPSNTIRGVQRVSTAA